MKTSNWLANIFEWNRQVIEAAETPFAKLAIFILPILSPVVPAFMTGLHVFKLMHVIFDFGEKTYQVSISMAFVVGVVLELIGYVGAISFVRDVYEFVKTRTLEYLVPAVINGLAYGFYLLAMYLINFQLGQYFQTPDIVNNIVGLLSFITVPTGLLAANHLSKKERDEIGEKRHQEALDFKLKQKALNKGINIFQTGQPAAETPRRVSEKHASDFKEKIPQMLQEQYSKDGRVLELTEITAKLKLDHGKNKGFVSTERKKWMERNNISKGASSDKLTF